MKTLVLLQTQGACAGSGEALFFPDRSQGPRGADQAKAVCSGCPVRRECLQYALDENMDYGIWGGTTPAERRRMT